jgi:hypothetical protein
MNIKATSAGLAVALAVGILGILPTFATEIRLVVVGENGQVLSFSDSGGHKTITPLSVSFPGRRIVDAYCVPSDRALYVSTDDAKLYKLDLSDVSSDYQRVDTTNDAPFFVWYDGTEKRPAWLHLGDKKSAKAVRFRGADSRIRASRHEDIEFTGGFVFGMHIDGWKTTGTLAGMSSDLAALPAKYPDDQWIIVGRSKKIAAYIRKPAIPVKTGEPVPATLLFQDRIRNRWSVETMDEYCQVSVYADVAVLRGLHDIKGDKDPATGNDVQAKPSGKWYFYQPSQPGITAYELAPWLTVQYATASTAIISGNGQLLMLTLGKPDRAKPELLAELPPGFSVIAVCPL